MGLSRFAGALAFAALAAAASGCAASKGAGEDLPTDEANGRGPGDEEPGRRPGAVDPVPEPDLPSPLLKEGPVTLLGIVGDDAVNVDPEAGALFAVPVEGGDAAKISDFDADKDQFRLAGGAVAVWRAIEGGLGTLSVWTRAGGAKADVATGSAVGLFAATETGSRVVYSVNTTVTDGKPVATDLRVAAGATPATSIRDLTASNKMNLAAALGDNPTCRQDVAFVGEVLFAAYCTGTAADETAARLLKVEGTLFTRLDALTTTAAGTIRPYWYADGAGARVFVRSTTDQALFITVATRAKTVLDTNAVWGMMLEDGSAVVYRTAAGALKRATTAATPLVSTLVPSGVKALLDVSADHKRLLYRTLDPQSRLTDIRLLDLTAADPQPVDLVPTAAAMSYGFTASSGEVVFLTDLGSGGATLKAKAIAGGDEAELAKGVGATMVLDAGSSIVISTNRTTVTIGDEEIVTYDLRAVDAAKPGAPLLVNSAVMPGFRARGGTVVYTRMVVKDGAPAEGTGLYSAAIP